MLPTIETNKWFELAQLMSQMAQIHLHEGDFVSAQYMADTARACWLRVEFTLE